MDGDDTLNIYQCTAWCEQEGFRQFIEEKFPSIKVYWQDQEPGLNNYTTNSFDYFPERYFLDSYEEPLYFESLNEAVECVQKIVDHQIEPTVEAIEKVLDEYMEKHEDDDVFYSFHEFKLCND